MDKSRNINGLDETASSFRVSFTRSGSVSAVELLKHQDAFRVGEGTWTRSSVPGLLRSFPSGTGRFHGVSEIYFEDHQEVH